MNLRPCPFCQEQKELTITVHPQTQYMNIECLNCGATGWHAYYKPDKPSFEWLNECEAKWNGDYKKP